MVETFQKQRNYALYDKFWYLKRAEIQEEYTNSQTGLQVDDLGNVTESILSQ